MVAGHTSLSPSAARALADPLRLSIVAALGFRPRTADSLARELGASEAQLSRHLRALQTMGLVKAAEEGGRRTYDLAFEPVMWEAAWAELPLPVRRSATATTLRHVHAAASAAIENGGFDRPDMVLARTRLRVTEAQWRETSRALADMLRSIDELGEAADADASGEPRVDATAVLMLFAGDHAQTEVEPPAPEFGEDEALERATTVIESLEATVVEPTTAWDRIEAMAEELRLLARAAKTLDGAATQPAPKP